MDWIKITKKYKRGFISILAVLCIWELLVSRGLVSALLISKPSQIMREGLVLLLSAEFWTHFFSSMEAVAIGFALAVFCGISLGMLAGFSKRIYDYVRPYVYALNALPIVAIVPLIIIWFGIGTASRISVIFLMSLTPILISSIAGVKNTDDARLLMAKSFGAGNFFTLRSVTFFHALPYVFSGLQIAFGRAVVGLVISEVFGYGLGLGYLVSFYGATFQTARLLFVVSILLVVSMAGSGFIALLEKKYIFWK